MRDGIGYEKRIPTSWVRFDNERDAIVVEVPVEYQLDIINQLDIPGRRDASWEWIGGPGFTVDKMRDLVAKGDPDARSRLSAKSEQRLNYLHKGAALRVGLKRSVVGAPVVAAAIGGHPLSCVQRTVMPMEAEYVWIDAGMACQASAKEIWEKCTPQLIKAVSQSRTRPVVALVYLATFDINCRPQGYSHAVVYTKIPINPYSWSRLSQLAHPSWLRCTALNVCHLLSDSGTSYECGYILTEKEGYGLKRAIGDPARWFSPERIAETRTAKER